MSGSAERRALGLVAVVFLLGVSVRLARAVHAIPPPTPAQERALDAQIARVDSARAAGRGTRVTRRVSSRSPSSRSGAASSASGPAAAPSLVDLETASAAQLDGLPWIGPALAARIIASRERCGPFGSLEGLKRVYGIGDGVAKRLAPYVTFSAASRPTSATRPPGCAGADEHAANRQRERP